MDALVDANGYSHDSCAQCGKNQSSASNLTKEAFKVNSANNCGHKFCNSCIEREFSKKRQFACQRCGTMVSKDKLSDKSFDETEVEKDFRVRKKLKGIYNKTEADFPSLKDYNDYQEMVEDLIQNLVYQTDVEKCKEAINRYCQQNAESITLNKHKKVEDLKEEYNSIRTQKDDKRLKDIEFQRSFNEDIQHKKDQKRQMNQIMLGDKREADIVTCGLISTQNQIQNQNLGSGANNPVLAFLAQRPTPQPILKGAQLTEYIKVKQRAKRKGSILRKVHQVGGYDFANYDKKNWSEIHYHLQQMHN
jgi:CDK-activating kinase assembly factor MAT1